MSIPIALSFAEGCAQSSRFDVQGKYASAHRFIARLASEIFLNSLQKKFLVHMEYDSMNS